MFTHWFGGIDFVQLNRIYFSYIMEGNVDGSASMDVGDSRKRPLDTDSDHSATKRSNYGHGER